MHRLTLEWVECDRTLSQSISSEKATKIPGLIRIGRDAAKCDVVLNDTTNTVSGLHVEIFFESRTNEFFLRNCTKDRAQPNPALVDGRRIIQEEIPIRIGSRIQIGKMVLNVKDIQLPQGVSQQAQEKTVYGVQCINGHIVSYKYVGDFCPHCGTGLQAVGTVVMPPPQK